MLYASLHQGAPFLMVSLWVCGVLIMKECELSCRWCLKGPKTINAPWLNVVQMGESACAMAIVAHCLMIRARVAALAHQVSAPQNSGLSATFPANRPALCTAVLTPATFPSRQSVNMIPSSQEWYVIPLSILRLPMTASGRSLHSWYLSHSAAMDCATAIFFGLESPPVCVRLLRRMFRVRQRRRRPILPRPKSWSIPPCGQSTSRV